MPHQLPRSFYTSDNILQISKDLLGKVLLTKSDNNEITGGIITEVEAYKGPEDKASHAYLNKRTPRNEAMYLEGGHVYVFICYGMHILFNIVTHIEDSPHAILVRSVVPYKNIELMKKRRRFLKNVSCGPGVLTQALGITKKDNGLPLSKERVWIEDRGIQVQAEEILTSPRIGIDYAKEHAKLPWRFYIKL